MGGGNMTNGTMMGNNMSMPFKMGVLTMPMMCTTTKELVGSLSGMFGGIADKSNATQQTIMDMMKQQMMASDAGFGMQNMTESELQQLMDFVICSPAMGEEMMQSMMGNGHNSTSGMMYGMMTQ